MNSASEASLTPSRFNSKKAAFYKGIISSIETIPLMIFVFIRAFEVDIPHRILTGGALSIFIFCFAIMRLIKFTPPYFATNLFFIIASTILISPFDDVSLFFLELGEVGMFLTILIVGIFWHLLSKNGLLEPSPTPTSKIYSWILLGVFLLCPFLALHFRGNENLAGALPFIIIIIAEKALSYFRSRRTQRNIWHAK